MFCRCAVRFPCCIGVLLGILMLLCGTIVILIWAFVPNFSEMYPIGLQAGAVTCGLGVLLVICGLIGLYRWHLRVSGTAIRQTSSTRDKRSSHGRANAHELYIATPSSFSLTEREEPGGLKKAHSTAYISLGSVQAEKIKVLGLVHGFISTTDLRHPWRMTSASLKGSTTQSQSNGVLRDPPSHTEQQVNTSTALLNGDFTPVAVATQGYMRFTREKSLRRSLPRVLVHPPLIRPRQESHSQTNLSETSVEGLQLDADDLKTSTDQDDSAIPTETCAKHDVGSRHSNREVNFSQPDADIKPKRHLTRVLTTPPIGRASLFNLTSPDCLSTSVLMSNGGSALNGSNPSNKIAQEHDTSLDRTNSGKRYLLMNQTGQMISCTTLFGEELDMEPANSNSASGVGCRRLQACPGWNFFPVFVEHDRVLSDNELRKSSSPLSTLNQKQSVHLSDCGSSFANSDLECGGAQTDAVKCGLAPRSRRCSPHHHSRVLDRVRLFFRRVQLLMPGLVRGVRTGGSKHPADVEALTSDVCGERGLLISNHASPASAQKSQIMIGQPARTEMPAGLNVNSDATVCVAVDSTRPTRFSTGTKDYSINGDDSTANLCDSETQDTLNNNNASVFSLPAISPHLWTADRPVWIMGVPVADTTDKHHWLAAMDTCDVILLRERQESNYDPGTVTGSSSSVYAFHVRPPSRLHPVRTTTTAINAQMRSAGATRSHGRARSLGRILFSDKSSLQS